jgi:RTX calcium-binding nonapeptide repeat (4 copies)
MSATADRPEVVRRGVTLLSTRSRRPKRIALLTAIAVGAAAATSMAGALMTAAVASPQPAWVKVTTDPLDDFRVLTFQAGDGVPNHVELREVSGGIEIKDTAGPVGLAYNTEPGCATVDGHTVRCSVDVAYVYMYLADGNDYFKDYTANIDQVIALGDDGDDLLLGGLSVDIFHAGNGEDELHGGGAASNTLRGDAGNDHILGGTGPDWLTGGDGDDYLHGADGDDHVIEGPGADDVQGGYGKDTVEYPDHDRVNVTLDNVANDGTPPVLIPWPRPGEGDNVRSNVENIVGSPGNDSLTGSDKVNHIDGRGGNDVLKGGAGNDSVDGGEGSDKLYGENGDDNLDAQHGTAQEDHGGPGEHDTCVGYDTVRDETCEH